MDAWSILEMEPTADTDAIRRAYARLAGKYHPEEEPEKFLQLRKAYQEALRWAENRQEPDTEPADIPDHEEDVGGWRLSDTAAGPNPYRDYAAIREFADLYTGKQRRNPKIWMDFVTSASFLHAMREPDFTAQLLEEVSSRAGDCPPSKECLTWLAIAYQYNQEEAADENGRRGRQFHLMHGAQFDGIESIFRIALMGPRPKRFAGNELAMFISFSEYNRLNALADAGNWSEPAFAEASQHIGRYCTSYLHDKCSRREWNDTERHPAGLRLLEDFFRRGDVPGELYRILWQKLDLKSAVFGRSKVLYKNLRELVQERVPGIGEEEPENFLQLNREHSAYCVRIQKNPEREDEESAALFERADFQRVLRSRRFIEEQLLSFSCWMSDKTGGGFLRRVLEFYGEHTDLPYAEQVQEKVRRMIRERRVKQWNAEDRDAPGVEYYERLTLKYRPFFRHWLNTGFYTARNPESGLPLLAYLNQSLPYLPDWSRRFLTKEDGTVQPRTIAVSMGRVEITLHRRFMSFEINGDPVYRPCLSWEEVLEEGGEWMLCLLPVTAASYGQYEEVRREIWRRLPRTAAPVEDYELIAGCLAGMVCRLPNEDAAPLPLEIFAEDSERLYGASWFEREGLLVLFEQTFDGRRALPNGEYHGIFDEKEAEAKAKQLLEEAASPKNYDLSQLNEMPFRLYALPLNAPEVELSVLDRADDGSAPELDCEDEDDDFQMEREEKGLAAEIVLEYLRQFAGGKLRRLQLEWYDGNLVFVMDKSGYACFYFETFGRTKTTWYTLISQPDIYQNVEHDEVKYYPFGMGKLAEYCLFHDTTPIMSKLDLILMSVSRGSPQTRAGGSWLWSTTTNLQDAEHRLIIAKIKLAGYPPRRCRNYPLKKFVISKYPAEVESVDNAGEKTTMTVRSGSYGQASAALIQFMQEKLTRLRLTWTAKEGAAGHLVLLRNDNCYMMTWLQANERRAVFCTADGTGESLFNGRPVPAHLVHHDLKQIRSCLDLMLDDMTDPSPVTDRLFTPCPEGWPYEEIFRELVGTN